MDNVQRPGRGATTGQARSRSSSAILGGHNCSSSSFYQDNDSLADDFRKCGRLRSIRNVREFSFRRGTHGAKTLYMKSVCIVPGMVPQIELSNAVPLQDPGKSGGSYGNKSSSALAEEGMSMRRTLMVLDGLFLLRPAWNGVRPRA